MSYADFVSGCFGAPWIALHEVMLGQDARAAERIAKGRRQGPAA
jgi:hypothetical protein